MKKFKIKKKKKKKEKKYERDESKASADENTIMLDEWDTYHFVWLGGAQLIGHQDWIFFLGRAYYLFFFYISL